MNCERLLQGRLVEYLAGTLDEAGRLEVERHLASCARCKAEADSMGATVSALRSGLAARRDAAPRLDAARRRDILGAGRGKRPEVIRASTWWVRSQPLLNVAALLVLTFVCIGLFMPALSGSRKQASISAARAREAQRQLAVELAEVDARAGKYMADADASKPQSPLVINDSIEAPSDASGVAQDKARSGSEVASITVAMPAEESKKKDSINGETTIAFGRREGGGRKMALRAYGGGRAQAAQSVPMASEAAKAEADDYAVDAAVPAASFSGPATRDGRDALVAAPAKAGAERLERSSKENEPSPVLNFKAPARMKGLLGSKSVEKKFKAVALDETGHTAGFAAEAGSEERVQEMAAEARDSLARTGLSRDADSPSPRSSPARGEDAQGGPVSGDKAAEVAQKSTTPSPFTGEGGGEGGGEGALKRIVPAEKEELVEKPIEEPAPVYGQEVETAQNPFSTFSIDVDTASFTRSRQFLLNGKRPSPGGVRVEEFVNAFEYEYSPPERRAFAVYADRSRSPFRSPLELLRIGVRGRVIGRDRQKQSVLTLVIDASGSMNTPDRLDLVKTSLGMLLDSMGRADRISIVTFGSETRLVLDGTPLSDKAAILAALDRIQTSGSTQLEGGIKLGYETAARHFRSGAVNRVLILSDGVANLGAGTAQEILAQVEGYRRQGIYCSVFGFGKGPYNDAMLETLADKGDGVYRFVDTPAEARRVFVEDLAATLHTIARDVKIQVEFDPRRVKTYRQLGYENRALTKEQFRDDTVDAGEVGSGQSVTALYEIRVQGNAVDPLGTVRVRWMDPETGKVEEMEQPLRASDRYGDFDTAPTRFRLAVAVAEFADRLRGHPMASGTDWSEVERVVRAVALELPLDQRVADLVRMVTAARNMGK